MTGLAVLEIDEYPFGDRGLEAYYTEFCGPATLMLDPQLPEAYRRARELEAHGYARSLPPTMRGRVKSGLPGQGIFLYSTLDPQEVMPETVFALRLVIAEMEPEWIVAVAEAKWYSDCPRVMAAWAELPIQVVLAALEILKSQERWGA